MSEPLIRLFLHPHMWSLLLERDKATSARNRSFKANNLQAGSTNQRLIPHSNRSLCKELLLRKRIATPAGLGHMDFPKVVCCDRTSPLSSVPVATCLMGIWTKTSNSSTKITTTTMFIIKVTILSHRQHMPAESISSNRKCLAQRISWLTNMIWTFNLVHDPR